MSIIQSRVLYSAFEQALTIQLPVSLRYEQLDIPDVSNCRVRVLFLRSEEERKEWVEITEKLKNSTNFHGKTVRFQVQRFSGYERSSVSYYVERPSKMPVF